jgi:riboflavin biosynthesis pyrimidine reductase
MRRLLPEPADDVDVADAYMPPRVDGSFVRLNMISSIDGAVTVGGTSGALGGPPDKKVFATLRSTADVILVGAGTARAEKYGPAHLDDDTRRAREARGQQPEPPIAVVSSRGEFDFATPFFTEATSKPIIVAPRDAFDTVRAAAGDAAEVLATDTDRVDLVETVAQLAGRGYRYVLAEGGPRLNGDLARAHVLDELCLTVSPRIVGGDGPRVIAGPAMTPPYEPALMHLLEEDRFLFYRLALRA